MSINRWEHDKTLPQPRYREQLCRLFNLSAHVLFGTPVSQESFQHEAVLERSICEVFDARQELRKEGEAHMVNMTQWMNQIEARMDILTSQIEAIRIMVQGSWLCSDIQNQVRAEPRTLLDEEASGSQSLATQMPNFYGDEKTSDQESN